MFFVSPSGGVTGDILVQIIKQLDEQEIFVREHGLTPMIILDGHESRLHLPFLTYIDKEGTKWIICHGTPYGTSYWQVGDSPEQNGSFKMAWIAEKRDLVTYKTDRGLQTSLTADDLMPLLNRAWQRSFARERLVTKAIAM